MNGIAITFLLGALLIALNEVTAERTSRVVFKYIPRDLDSWFKDPQNQPSYMFLSLFGDNVRMM
jgi:hypothetical protein